MYKKVSKTETKTNGFISKRKDWSIQSSKVSKATVNPIRNIVDGMKLTPNPSKSMIALSIGDPCVFGNLGPPEEACKAVIKAINEKKCNGYAPSTGYEFSRNAVAEYSQCEGHSVQAKDVILTSGCSSALEMCITVLANPGDSICIPKPGFSIYKTLAESVGIKCNYYDLRPDKDWEINLDSLEESIDNNTAFILINNPSNPCGSVFSRQHMRDILKIAEKYKLPIIADEIYSHFVFDDAQFFFLASLTDTVPILSCGGLTKRFLVPGWRMGWIVIYDKQDYFKDVRIGLNMLSMRILGPNTLVQGAIPEIIKKTPDSFFKNTLDLIMSNANIAFKALSKAPGLKPVKPMGAMYMMVGIDINHFEGLNNDSIFTQTMVYEQSVFCLPGKCFEYPNFFRIVLTVPNKMMIEACDRIVQFCQDHYS